MPHADGTLTIKGSHAYLESGASIPRRLLSSAKVQADYSMDSARPTLIFPIGLILTCALIFFVHASAEDVSRWPLGRHTGWIAALGAVIGLVWVVLDFRRLKAFPKWALAVRTGNSEIIVLRSHSRQWLAQISAQLNRIAESIETNWQIESDARSITQLEGG